MIHFKKYGDYEDGLSLIFDKMNNFIMVNAIDREDIIDFKMQYIGSGFNKWVEITLIYWEEPEEEEYV